MALDENTIEQYLRQVRLSRQAAGLTQMDVASRMKISHTKISLFENGLATLSLDEMRRLDQIINSELDKVGRSRQERIEYAYESAAKKDGVPERKRLRQRADLSQAELAKASGISQSRLSLWETGQVQLSTAEIARWRSALRTGLERAVSKSVIIEREVLKDKYEQLTK